MDITTSTQLPMAQAGGCACCAAPDTDAATESVQAEASGTQTFAVAGMTCGHCASAVTSELQGLPGVTDVSVDLVAGGTSTVKVAAETPLTEADVSAALGEAGNYELVGN